MDLRLLRSKMPREKLINSANDVSIEMDESRPTFANYRKDKFNLYYVEMDMDEENKRLETDVKRREKSSKEERERDEKLQNGMRGGVRTGRDEDDVLKDRKNCTNNRTKTQQGAEDEEKKMTSKEKLAEKKEKKRTQEHLSEYELSSSEDDEEEDEDFELGAQNSQDLEKMAEVVEMKKQLISTLRSQPWSMQEKLYILRKSQAFVEKFEFTLGEGRGRRFYTYKVWIRKKWMKFQRNYKNFKKACIPWEGKIKAIESRYGSSVSSYFKFMRWTLEINIIPFFLSFGLVMCPEALLGKPYGSIPRKTVSRKELPSALDIDVVWDIGGYMKYSVFFCGYYDNQKTIGWIKYHMPLCYLLVGLGSMVYSCIVVVEAMARNASVNSGRDDTRFNYSWKVFTGWDYLIGNPETADCRFAAISTNLKEAIADEKEINKDENVHLIWLLRFVANVLILFVMIGSSFLIYYVVLRSEIFIKNGMDNYGWWERNEANVVMSLLTIFGPMLFDVISQLENFHPRVALKWQIGRSFALYLGNIYSFLIAVIDQIRYSRDEEEEVKRNITLLEESLYNRTMTQNYTTPIQVDPADFPRGPCWETMVGQEFIRMLIADTFTVFGVVLVGDFVRAVLVRVLNYCCCWDLEFNFPGYSEFDVSGNVLTLIFNQGMTWMGTFYAPCLPGLNLIKLQLTIYLQAWAIMACNIPHVNVFKATHSNSMYMLMMVALLILSILPTIFTIVAMRPSFDCGPYSGMNHMYDIIAETIKSDLPTWFGKMLGYISNPGLVLTFLLFMFLTVYYLHATSKTYQQANRELKKRLHAHTKETRIRTKHVYQETAECLEQYKTNGKTQDNLSEKRAGGDSEKSRQSFLESRPAQSAQCTGRGSSYKRYQAPPYTQPPAPRSYLVQGQVPVPVPGPPAL